jgi:DHA3 family macrolide efflux protein-like MFS transporter
MGRVFSIIHIIAASAMPLAILFFGPMADVISVELILIISGVLLIMVGYFYHLSSRKLLIV